MSRSKTTRHRLSRQDTDTFSVVTFQCTVMFTEVSNGTQEYFPEGAVILAM